MYDMLALVAMSVCIVVVSLLYIKLTHPFWALQPVFHIYDIHRWFRNAGVLSVEMPTLNRFVNLQSITTVEMSSASSIVIADMCNLIRQHYFRNARNGNVYAPTNEHIVSYLQGHNAPVYISYFTKQLIVTENQKIWNLPTMAGVITSRPLHVWIYQMPMDVYYVDFLCVHSHWRKQQIAPQLIQTHEYRQSRGNRAICVSLFKREDELTLLVPAVAYKAVSFTIHSKLLHSFGTLHSSSCILPFSSQNVHDLRDFLETERVHWDLWVCPDVSHLLVLSNTNNLWIYLCVSNRRVNGVYIFRNTASQLSKGQPIVSCIAVVHRTSLSVRMAAMMECVRHIATRVSYTQLQLCVEPLGSLHDMSAALIKKSNPSASTSMAYYWYNFAHQPFVASKCVIIN